MFSRRAALLLLMKLHHASLLLAQPWLALARLLWEAKRDSAGAEEALVRAFAAAWLHADPHPDDAIRFPNDLEVSKPKP